MPKLMKIFAFASILATVGAVLSYYFLQIGIFLTLSLTFATIAYHFVMRLTVGYLVHLVMKNHADYGKRWYREHAFEKPLYRILGVKKWKDKLPSYHPQDFSWKKHTFHEIAQAMCQAEIVHEIIVVLSFLPILAGLQFGLFPVWITTSAVSAGFDLLFVILQRYNRPRVLKLAEKQK